MALRTIITDDDPILHKKSREVTVFNDRLHQLLDDMYDTMTAAQGVGLAAVQIGVLRRVAVIDIGDGRIELVNPVITEKSEETCALIEGCLSYPGTQGVVERPVRVTVQAQDRKGDMFTLAGEDLLARAICHEVDHLDGVVYSDVAERMIEPDEEDEE